MKLDRKKSVMLRRSALLAAASALLMFGLHAFPASAEPIKDRVLKEGSITIGIANNAPWGFLGADQDVTGIQPDTVKAVLGPMGLKKVDFVVLDWGALIPSLLSNKIDAIVSGMAITPQRCEQVIFSNPDIAVGDAILVSKGNPKNIHSYEDIEKNPALRLGGSRGSTNSENAIKAGIPKDRMQLFQDDQSAFAALLAGRIDAYTLTSPSVINALKDPSLKERLDRAVPFTGYVQNGKEFANYAAVVFRPEDGGLRDLYNESLAERKQDGALAKLAEKYGFSATEIASPDVTAKSLCGDKYR
ncbi:ectoine/hydroxyectoine ABC transporter substrate-binding protein EhuB [Phyllobacterium chamaecytisi]|uniref:ectoine/hydroxyectoine ABC transporter substrate-binding protein EhuB n=1 Tax=Phyllobacterium chamaecytisi TaxID=2876082 RepID=UPI001CC9514A|nr:ectoine/hydroxyectoine ABC transporter substrate-binding protein EhuB [Phyllobacterium sp. KW56]MBZ9605561.1 ectoine/hydroxyectoine ABC transporter substrate-binding protein EhuB [Phyllobacterium sp. KW56]